MEHFFNIGYFPVKLVNIADLALVAFLAYKVYTFIKGTPVLDILLGFLLLYIIYVVVSFFKMNILATILGQFMDTGVIIIAIIFQQEIRKFLFLVGDKTALKKINLLNYFPWNNSSNKAQEIDITPILESVKTLGKTNVGALIVISKDEDLTFYEQSGDIIDSLVSKRLLLSIFNKNSPMHDGAVILYKNRIRAARCILPITERQNLPPHYGLRHRAAIGITEITNVLVVVVSEETGQISIVHRGKINPNLSAPEIRDAINKYFEN